MGGDHAGAQCIASDDVAAGCLRLADRYRLHDMANTTWSGPCARLHRRLGAVRRGAAGSLELPTPLLGAPVAPYNTADAHSGPTAVGAIRGVLLAAARPQQWHRNQRRPCYIEPQGR